MSFEGYHKVKCKFRINANLVKEDSLCINAKFVKEGFLYQEQLHNPLY